MRVLILSCNTGEGHNSAARAIAESLAGKGVECDIRNALSYVPHFIEKLICKGHLLAYREFPNIYGLGYKIAEKFRGRGAKSNFSDKRTKPWPKGLYDIVCGGRYDVVICVHVFAALMMKGIERKLEKKPLCCFVATDYTCSPGVASTSADAYFIPHPKLTEEFLACGIEKGKLVPVGIPISERFYRQSDRRAEKAALGIPEGKKIVLLMCGSMGCGPLRSLAEAFHKKRPSDAQMIVVCGTNRKLLKRLGKMKSDTVQARGYTNEIAAYMDVADVILTKPGGLTTTETIAKGKPMILVEAVKGCETRNCVFLCNNGFAQKADSVADAIGLLNNELNCPDGTDDKNSTRPYMPRKAADQIADYLLGLSSRIENMCEIC